MHRTALFVYRVVPVFHIPATIECWNRLRESFHIKQGTGWELGTIYSQRLPVPSRMGFLSLCLGTWLVSMAWLLLRVERCRLLE